MTDPPKRKRAHPHPARRESQRITQMNYPGKRPDVPNIAIRQPDGQYHWFAKKAAREHSEASPAGSTVSTYEATGETIQNGYGDVAEIYRLVPHGWWHMGGSALVSFDDLDIEALTEAAKEAFEEVTWSLEKTLTHATNFGRILSSVRKKIPHGEWSGWVQGTFGDTMSLRKIQRYMQIANASDQTLLEGAKTIDEALERISEPKPRSCLERGRANDTAIVQANPNARRRILAHSNTNDRNNDTG